MIKKSHAFTLIELLIVIMIIGIIVAIAAPMMSRVKNKAIVAEAVTALGALRSAMQSYYAEFQKYPTLSGCLKAGGPSPAIDPAILNSVIINADDFEGTYFPAKSYLISSTDIRFYIYCFVSLNAGASEAYYVDNPDTKNLSDHINITHAIRLDTYGNMRQRGLADTGLQSF